MVLESVDGCPSVAYVPDNDLPGRYSATWEQGVCPNRILWIAWNIAIAGYRKLLDDPESAHTPTPRRKRQPLSIRYTSQHRDGELVAEDEVTVKVKHC